MVYKEQCEDMTPLYRQVDFAKQQYEDWTRRLDDHNRSISNINDWNNLSGNYSGYQNIKRDLENEIKHWNDCTGPWNRVHHETHNDWCENDLGKGWYHFKGDGNAHKACAWFINPTQWHGACKRTSSKVESDLRDRMNREGNGRPSNVSHPGNAPSPNISNNVVCCQQAVNDVISHLGNVNVSNFQQNCRNEINSLPSTPKTDAAQPPTLPTPTPSPLPTPATGSALSFSDSANDTNSNNNLPLIIIIFFTIIMLSSSSVASVLLI